MEQLKSGAWCLFEEKGQTIMSRILCEEEFGVFTLVYFKSPLTTTPSLRTLPSGAIRTLSKEVFIMRHRLLLCLAGFQVRESKLVTYLFEQFCLFAGMEECNMFLDTLALEGKVDKKVWNRMCFSISQHADVLFHDVERNEDGEVQSEYVSVERLVHHLMTNKGYVSFFDRGVRREELAVEEGFSLALSVSLKLSPQTNASGTISNSFLWWMTHLCLPLVPEEATSMLRQLDSSSGVARKEEAQVCLSLISHFANVSHISYHQDVSLSDVESICSSFVEPTPLHVYRQPKGFGGLVLVS